MAEVWRVVLRGGSVREMGVYFDESNAPYTDSRYRWCAGGMRGRTAYEAVFNALYARGMLEETSVLEILAPGEPTRAEAVAAVTAERDDARAEVETLCAEAALLREKLAAATTRVEELEESTAMACQSPADGCDCAGCLYAAERGGES